MSARENEALVQRFYDEFWCQGNLAAADHLCSPDFQWHFGGMPDVTNLAAFKQLVADLLAAFPDYSCSVSAPRVAEGDLVVTRYAWTGTQRGPFMGIPPTGRQVAMTGITIDRVADGKVVEEWCEENFQALMKQLGEVPAAA